MSNGSHESNKDNRINIWYRQIYPEEVAYNNIFFDVHAVDYVIKLKCCKECYDTAYTKYQLLKIKRGIQQK